MMNRPDMPRCIAAVFCSASTENPISKNVSFIEITPVMFSRKLPAEMPPLVFAAILVGGQPGRIYTTRLRMKGPNGATISEVAGPDIPFTSQWKRVNIAWSLQAISSDPEAIKSAGKYVVELISSDVAIARAEIDIDALPGGTVAQEGSNTL